MSGAKRFNSTDIFGRPWLAPTSATSRQSRRIARTEVSTLLPLSTMTRGVFRNVGTKPSMMAPVVGFLYYEPALAANKLWNASCSWET